MNRRTNAINEALDLVEKAKKIIDPIDGPSGVQLHMAKVELEKALAGEALLAIRKEWREMPVAG